VAKLELGVECVPKPELGNKGICFEFPASNFGFSWKRATLIVHTHSAEYLTAPSVESMIAQEHIPSGFMISMVTLTENCHVS